MNITVFTPTYNRAPMLEALFQSLLSQTCTDFEWLVIDDGSTDDTSTMIENFRRRASFPIHYVFKNNGGKHTAYNLALNHAHGRWFLCLDSDDLLTADAIALLTEQMLRTPELKGAMAYKQDHQGRCLGDTVPKDLTQMNLHDLGLRYNCRGDYVFAYETDLAKKYPFPVFSGERFVPESVVLDMLGKECPIAVIRAPLMVCEYHSGGYSADFSRLMKQNPLGFCLYFQQRIDLTHGWKQRLVTAGKYHCFRLLGGKTAPVYAGPYKLATALAWPLGLCFRLYYKLLRGF